MTESARLALPLAILALAAGTLSCERSTGPTVVRSRTVGVQLVDSLGVPQAGKTVRWFHDLTGAPETYEGQSTTDASGFASRSLPSGDWVAASRLAANAAAATFRVAGSERVPRDTQLVRLVLKTGSTVHGTVRRPDGTPASGTSVMSAFLTRSDTDASGVWTLGTVPGGRWSFTVISGFDGSTSFAVTVPDSTSDITAPDAQLPGP